MSLKQYEFCEICKISHTDIRKHGYTSKHKTTVSNIVKKFSEKVKECRLVCEKPQVEIHCSDKNRKVWCYFCDTEVQKHAVDDTFTIICASLIDHLSRCDHVSSCKNFLKKNRILTKDSLKDLTFDQSECDRFQSHMKQTLKTEKERQLTRLMKARKSIEDSEARRRSESHDTQKISSSSQPRVHNINSIPLPCYKVHMMPPPSYEVQMMPPRSQNMQSMHTTVDFHDGSLLSTNRDSMRRENQTFGSNQDSGNGSRTSSWVNMESYTFHVDQPNRLIGPTMKDLDEHKKQIRKKKFYDRYSVPRSSSLVEINVPSRRQNNKLKKISMVSNYMQNAQDALSQGGANFHGSSTVRPYVRKS